MRLLGIVILLASGVYGQTVSNIRFDGSGGQVGDSSARVIFDVSAPFNKIQVRYGTSDCAGGTGGTVQNSGTATSTYRQYGMTIDIAGLAPATSYFVCPEVSSDGGMTWSSGVSAMLTTAVRVQMLPVPPQPVSINYPAQTGSTLNVASNCSDLQIQINAAAPGDTIVVPAGTVCTGNYVLPMNPGTVQFTSANVRTSDSRITITGHAFTEDQEVRMDTPNASSCLPGSQLHNNSSLSCIHSGGWVIGERYWVHVVDANNIQLMDDVDGNPVVPGWVNFTVDDGADTITFAPDWRAPNGFEVAQTGGIPTDTIVQFHSTGTLPGGLAADTDYYLLTSCPGSANAPCVTQVSLTASGAAVDITDAGTGTFTLADQGSGSLYISPAADPEGDWIVVRSSEVCAPEGVRVTPGDDGRMFTLRQDTPSNGTYRISASTLTYNWRFECLKFDTGTNDDYLTTTDPRPYGAFIISEPGTANLIFDRMRVQGPGYPNRLGFPAATIIRMDGENVGFLNSDLRGMDYWHPWDTISCSMSSNVVASCGTGTAFAGAAIFETTLTGDTTITLTSGSASGTGYLYVAMDGNLEVILPNGLTATCTTSGATCAVSNAASPNWPVNGNNRRAGMALATITISGGEITGVSNQNGTTSMDASEGTNAILAGRGPGPYIYDNNLFSGAGLPVHFDDSGPPFLARSDYWVTRNTFETPASLMAGGPESDSLRYFHRQPLEWKGGNRVKVDGNIFDGSFEEVSPIGINIAITPRSGGDMSDVDITNNSFVNTSGGVNLCVPIDSLHPVSVPCVRQRFSNNLFQLDGYRFRINGVSSGDGWAFYGGYATENILISHNTIYDNRGSNPALIHWIQHPTSGMRITDNIYFYTGNAPMIQNENTANCPGSDKTMMDCAFTDGPGNTAYQFSGNVLVPSWANTQAPSGKISTGTVENAIDGLNNNVVLDGSSVEDNLGLLGFTNATLNNPAPDLRLASTSPYRNTATDGTQAGADIEQLIQAQGQIQQLRATTPTATGFTVSAFVPDAGEPCYAGYGTSQSSDTWTWTAADTTQDRQRNIVLSGLTAGQPYYYSLACRRTTRPSVEVFRIP